MSNSLRPHRRQPTRLLCPWDSPGKNTGMGCHFLLQCMKVKSESEVAQSCLTPSDPHGLQPTRLLSPWDFPGKSTGVGCHCLHWLNNNKKTKYRWLNNTQVAQDGSVTSSLLYSPILLPLALLVPVFSPVILGAPEPPSSPGSSLPEGRTCSQLLESRLQGTDDGPASDPQSPGSHLGLPLIAHGVTPT